MFNTTSGKKSRSDAQVRRPASAFRARIFVAVLADRLTPAGTFTVNTTADTHVANLGDGTGLDANGKVSLRSAIEESNPDPGQQDRIGFDASVNGIGPNATISLTDPAPLPALNKMFTIVDATADDTVKITTARAQYRIFAINAGKTCSFGYLGITNGAAVGNSGGFMNNGGTLIISYCNIYNNQASGEGGGIYSSGNLSITDTHVSQNSVPFGWGGGIAAETIDSTSSVFLRYCDVYANNAMRGAGLFYRDNAMPASNQPALQLSSSQIYGNTATSSAHIQATGGGVLIAANTGSALIQDSSIVDNDSVGQNAQGGGIAITSGTLSVSNTSITGNTATSQGGGLYIANLGTTLNIDALSTLTGNKAAAGPGGAITAGATTNNAMPTPPNQTIDNV
jgi:predicted outer membrane repeat protein